MGPVLWALLIASALIASAVLAVLRSRSRSQSGRNGNLLSPALPRDEWNLTEAETVVRTGSRH